jgi:hypothetical protein
VQTNTLGALSSSALLRPAARVASVCALVGTITGALLAGAATPALALPTSDAAATAAAVQQGVETLTMDNLTRMYQAIVNLAVASKGHPDLDDALSVDADDSEAQATAKIAAIPAAVAALKKAGLTPSQYVRLDLTFAATEIGVAALKMNPSAKLPEGVSLANVRFLQQHAADIEAVQKRLAAQMAAAGVSQ